MVMNRQRLGWIGASIAAGIFPTCQMAFAPESLAPHAGPDGAENEDAQEAGIEVLTWAVPATRFAGGNSPSPSVG